MLKAKAYTVFFESETFMMWLAESTDSVDESLYTV